MLRLRVQFAFPAQVFQPKRLELEVLAWGPRPVAPEAMTRVC
jgi:hypothetical protein